MPLTLRTILAMDVLTAGRPEVLAGEQSLDRPVRWVHVTEVDDMVDLLGGHEVVLTTGLPLVGPTADPERFVTQLAEASACGLIVELGPRLPELPAALVRQARRLELPLVALHAPVRFVSITEAVHRLIVGEQYHGLELAQRTHEVFTNLSLDSADASTILAEASTLIGAPVVLEDVGHHVVALARHGRTSGALLRGWEERSRRAPVLDEAGTSGPERWLTCPVGLRGAPWGRIVAPQQTHDPVTTAMVMQRAAQALQLSRLVERDATRLQSQAQESLLQELVEGRVQDEADGLARAAALGMRAGANYLPVVALFGPAALPDQIARQRRARAQLETVSDALAEARLDAISGGVDDQGVGIVLALPRGVTEDAALEALATATASRAGALTPGTVPVLGVGRAAGTLLVAASRMPATVHVAEAARALQPSSAAWFRSTDVRLRGLVAQLRDDERVLGFAEAELGPLLAHEAEHGTGLLDLLRRYVELRGNKAALAQATHISRQALYGRLHKLESILRVDLDDADSVLSLGVALLVHDLRVGRARPGPGRRGTTVTS
ncbi:PucR family transcriptional regulator [Aeromicrobium sp. S22]|uniref:PucR family transcriptional regulator n=1 Tax=Aeromicrobium sp. S22 TaxID=2662029 RepID=UPI00129D534F|nr:PucR family transcriptional regulator [Aeromicrobium sp. S22]MRK03079.1 PucR family transcriptional regulator [Aeromicrobium sp. S22]